jgi:hypothetical protein
MAVPTDVDRAASVIAVHEIDIEAPLDTVWRLHTNVNAWPTWQTDITAAHIDGALESGVSFDWTSYGFSSTSTVYGLTEGSRVLWGGTSGGTTGVHEWLFSETPSGVHVTTTEHPVAGATHRSQGTPLPGVRDVRSVPGTRPVGS